MSLSNDKKSELRDLVGSACDGLLSEAQRNRLNELLASDPESRQEYLLYMKVHGSLGLGALGLAAPSSTDKRSAHAASPTPTGSSRHRVGLWHSLVTTAAQVLDWRHHPTPFLVTIAVLTAIFCGSLVLMIGSPVGTNGNERRPKSEFIATITHTDQAVWNLGQTEVQLGTRLLSGKLLELEKGLVHLLFRNGARIVVQGPAKFRVDTTGAMTLKEGRLLAQVSKLAQGFIVQTPNVDVVDLGTRFGLHVQKDETEIQVFKGKVQARRHDDARDQGRLLSAGKSAVFGNSPQLGYYVKEKKMNRVIYLSLSAMLALSANPDALAVLIPLQNATATHQSGGFPQGEAIDGTTTGNNGWAPSSGNVDLNPLIVFETVSDSDAGTYTFTLIHDASGGALDQHALARFRISATTDNRGDFADGIVGGDVTANWTELTPLSALSTVPSGATFSIIGNEVQVTGTNPIIDTYQVIASIPFGGVTGFRIETISSASSPTGPGRAGNRNFILTEFQVNAEPFAVPEPASGALLGLGGMMVVGLARRKRRRRNAA